MRRFDSERRRQSMRVTAMDWIRKESRGGELRRKGEGLNVVAENREGTELHGEDGKGRGKDLTGRAMILHESDRCGWVTLG